MHIGRYRFAPPWWGIVATLVGVALFVVAGIWQIERGQAKAVMLAQQTAARKSPAQPLLSILGADAGVDVTALYGRDFVAHGHYTDHQILLDNQVYKGQVGYRVWTPLVLADGRRMLVDRGWVALGPGGRDQPPVPPVPAGRVTVEGLLRGLPKPGMRLSEAPGCTAATWPHVLNYPTIDTVRCLYQAPVIDGVILLSEKAAHGFARDWQADIGMPPMRHYGYAVQWFALAIAVVVVFLVVNMKRKR